MVYSKTASVALDEWVIRFSARELFGGSRLVFLCTFVIRVARIFVIFFRARYAYRGEVLGVQADVLQSCITVKFSYS